MMPDLKTALLDLLHAMRDTEIRLILGGGFGIYLKTEHVRRSGARTLFLEWPEARSTLDLDLFLQPELLIQSEKLKPMAGVLTNLGYQVVIGAKNYQFVKPGSGGDQAGSIKIDFLTGPQSCFRGTNVKVTDRRAKPNPPVGIHAHPVDEAPTLEEGLLQKTLEGRLDSGDSWRANILLPHPFTFLMMKLFAFKDRLNDANREFGRYHSLDMYTILATTTEDEWESALKFRDKYRNEPYVIKAGQIVSKHFSALGKMGMIRLREHPLYRPQFKLENFISALAELFPSKE